MTITKWLKRVGAGSCAVALLGLAVPAPLQAATWTPGANGGDSTTWDLTDDNWNPAATAWSVGTDVAIFGTDGDAANIANATTVIPTNTGTGISFTGNGTINGPGNIGFTTTSAAIGIDVAATKTGTINADFLGVGNLSGTGNRILKTGSGTLTLAGNTVLVGDVEAALNAGFTVEGGGELQISNALKAASNTQSNGRGNFHNRVGDTTSNNVLTIDGAAGPQVFTGGLIIGNTGSNNSAYITRPGDSVNTTYRLRGNGQQLILGYNSDDNYLEVSNGAYFHHAGGSGTVGTRIGISSGADNNQLVVTGSASTLHLSSGSIVVGSEGNNNNVTVSNGGTVITPRWYVGVNSNFSPLGGLSNGTGDNNSVLITGLGSSTTINATGNSWFEIGEQVGANGNNFTVADQASFSFTGSGANRRFAVGVAGDNNYLRITGTGSTMSVNTNEVLPISIGGSANNGGVIDGGTGNHLDVFDGGVVTAATSILLLGTDSALNLGDGNAVAALTVADTPSFVDGIHLKNASGRLNFNNGRLNAGVVDTLAPNANLVSGPGTVELLGTAYFNVDSSLDAFVNSRTVSSQITGIGDLHKEGDNRLQLTSLSNSYTGDTYVDGGTLELQDDFLDDNSTVYIASGALLDLNFAATDIINGLFLNGVAQAAGTYGSTSSGATFQNDTFFAGTGVLNVLAAGPGPVVPEPQSILLAGGGLLGLLGLAVRRRRQR